MNFMNNQNYKLAIAYRIYPKITRNPPIYQHNKFELAKLCLKSFKNSLKNIRIKLWVLLDNCPPEYDILFRSSFNEDELELIKLNGIGNKRTFAKQIQILLTQKFSNSVYFAEDDYFYLPNQFNNMIQFLKHNPDVDFITPYDHIDYYNFKFHDYKSRIKFYGERHWREVNSTCLTFLTTKDILRKTKDVFLKYTFFKNVFKDKLLLKNPFYKDLIKEIFLNTSDVDIWTSLTKINAFKLFKMIRFRFHYRRIFGIYFRAWRYNWKQLLLGKKWKLWSPIPSIATHMESDLLAPTINWEDFF